jgi:hypothetical protein
MPSVRNVAILSNQLLAHMSDRLQSAVVDGLPFVFLRSIQRWDADAAATIVTGPCKNSCCSIFYVPAPSFHVKELFTDSNVGKSSAK